MHHCSDGIKATLIYFEGQILLCFPLRVFDASVKEVSSMVVLGKQILFLFVSLLLVASYVQMRTTKTENTIWERMRHALGYTFNTIPLQNSATIATAVAAFCETDHGVNVRLFTNITISSGNCFGSCSQVHTELVKFSEWAIEAPRLSALCLENPFHGFYDCIWPLVHFLTTCLALRHFKSPPIILINNQLLSEQRRYRWVVVAQETYLQQLKGIAAVVEKNLIQGDQCMCVRSLIRFKDHAFWRPVRFQYTQKFLNSTITQSHPAGTKRNGLMSFRQTILQSLALDTSPPRSNSPILLYGREDTKRRIWRNAAAFTELLRKEVNSDTRIYHIKEIPASFASQVNLFNNAALVITPHGAALANSLFMRQNSAILEIASKHCFTKKQMGMQKYNYNSHMFGNISDPNAWVPWHAESLGIYHIIAPCIRPEAASSFFETENESLAQVALVLLMLSKKVTA